MGGNTCARGSTSWNFFVKTPFAAIVSVLLFFPAIGVVQAAPAAAPAAVEATRQMLDAMHVRALMAQSMKQAEELMPAQMRETVSRMLQADATMNNEQKTRALQKFDAELPELVAKMHVLFSDPTLVDDMLAEIEPLYANSFTVDELHQLTAFYRSPLGRKMMANMPKLMAQSTEISNRVMMPRIQKLMSQTMQDVVGQ